MLKKNMWEIVWFTFQILPGRHEYESEVLKAVLVPDVVQLVAEELLLNILIRLINVRENDFFCKKNFFTCTSKKSCFLKPVIVSLNGFTSSSVLQ